MSEEAPRVSGDEAVLSGDESDVNLATMLPAAAAPALCLETLFAIRVETWLRVLAAFGAPPPLTGAVGASSRPTYDALEAALFRRDVPDALAVVLAQIEAFASEAARDALYEACDVLGYERGNRWRGYVSAADLVAGLLVDARSDAALAEIVEAARLRVGRDYPPRSWLQFAVRADVVIGDPARHQRTLARAWAAFNAATDRGAWSRVRAFGDARKAHFELAHEDRASGSAVVAEGALALDVRRAVRSHLASYDSPSRRLFVWTASPHLALAIAEMIGASLFGDPDAFFAEAAVSLAALQDASADGRLPRAGTVFSRVSLIGCTWDTGRGHTLSPRATDGADVYTALAESGLSMAAGHLRLATLRAETAPGVAGPRTADLSLRPPYAITCSEPALAPSFLRHADKLRITRPGARVRDWWALAPHRLTNAEWSDVHDIAALEAKKLLVECDPARRATHPRHRHAGPAARAFALASRPGVSYAVAEDLPAFLVGDADLARREIDFAKVAALAESELSSLAKKKARTGAGVDADGFLELAALDVGPTSIHFVACTRAPQPAALDRRRKDASPDHVVFVTPPGRKLPTGFAQATLESLAGPFQPLLVQGVRALGLQDRVAPTLYAPRDRRLVLHRATGRIYFDGVWIAKASDNEFRMLLRLAERWGQLTTAGELCQAISANSKDDALARKTIASFRTALAKSLRAAKVKVTSEVKGIVVKERHGEWRLTIEPFVA